MMSASHHRTQGFTLIEMMVVITVILILLGVAIPIYSHSLRKAQEDSFRHSLETLNTVIFQYTLDKQKPPQSLDELKQAGYISEIPKDITGSNTWVTEDDPPALLSIFQTETGIYGVHSGSNRIGSDGKPYSEW